MNPPLRNPSDASKYREQYMNNLALQASNNQMNYNANLIYKNTEQTPSQPTDYRTSTEKFADVDSMRREVRSFLANADLVNTTNANIVAQDLSDEELLFVIQYKSFIEKDFKGRDVPADVLTNYIAKLKEKTDDTYGVDYGLQQNTGEGILMGNEQIIDLVTKNDLERLLDLTRTLDGNVSLQRSAEVSVSNLMSQVLSQQDYMAIQSLSPADKYEVYSMLNETLQDVPTKAQFAETMRRGEYAKEHPSLRQDFLRGVTNTYQGNSAHRLMMREIEQSLHNMKLQELRSPPSYKRDLEEAEKYAMEIQNDNSLYNVTPAKLDFANVSNDSINQNPLSTPSTPFSRIASTSSSPSFSSLTPMSIDKTPSPAAFKRERGATNTIPTGRPANKKPDLNASEASIKKLPTTMDLEKDFADSPPKPVTSKSGKIKEMNEWLKGDEERYLTSNGRQYKHPIGDYEHHNTVNALHKDYGRKNASASSSGHGIHRIRLRGKGLSKRAKIEHRIEGEYTKPKPYKQLGRYLINRDKLLDDIVMLKRVGGSHVPDYPSQKVSVPIAAALSSILNQSAPNCDDMSSKDIQELQKILKLCRYEATIVLKVKGKGIEKSEEDKEMDRFEILKGEIEAGNDNKTLIKEFKLMLVRFMNAGRIPRRQAQDILVDIASMGL